MPRHNMTVAEPPVIRPIRGARRTLVVLSLALASCRAPLPVSSPTPDTLALRLVADQAAAPLLYDLVQHYRAENSLISWDIQVGDGQSVLDWLRAGQVPYGLVSVPPQSSSSDDPTLWAAPIGEYGVAFVTHPSNPVNSVSAAQLRGILQGRITNWRDLGGANQPIDLIAQDRHTSDGVLVQSIVLGEGRISSSARLMTTPTSVVAQVTQNPNAFGFVGMGYLTDAVHLLAVEGIAPGPDQLRAGLYPIRAPLAFVGLEPPGEAAYQATYAYRAFFAWAQSQAGQAIVAQRYGSLNLR